MSSTVSSSELLYFTERGSGPPLLLVHGLMVTGEMFEPVTGHLATRHRVIVPDLRGHGRSRGLPPPYTAAQLAADLLRLLDRCARLFPGRCHRATTGPRPPQAMRPPRARLHLRLQHRDNSRVARRPPPAAPPPRPRHQGVSEARRLTGREAARQGTCGLARRAHGGPGPQVDGGCVEGDDGVRQQAPPGRDRMPDARRRRLERSGVPIHPARMLHDGIPGSQLVIIDGADHTLIWTHPDELLRVTDEFLGA